MKGQIVLHVKLTFKRFLEIDESIDEGCDLSPFQDKMGIDEGTERSAGKPDDI